MKPKKRILLIEARRKKELGVSELADMVGIGRIQLYRLENCLQDGTISLWIKIQKSLSIKDSDMWSIINTKKADLNNG